MTGGTRPRRSRRSPSSTSSASSRSSRPRKTRSWPSDGGARPLSHAAARRRHHGRQRPLGAAARPRAPRAIARRVRRGELRPEQITSAVVGRHLGTAGIPDPDLLIRTSGEMRLSNFFLWQIAYTEIYVTDTLWPDFREREFLQALA